MGKRSRALRRSIRNHDRWLRELDDHELLDLGAFGGWYPADLAEMRRRLAILDERERVSGDETQRKMGGSR